MRLESAPMKSLEQFSNSYALASFVKCGFYFHPSDGDLSLGARLRKKSLNGLFSEHTYWRTAIASRDLGSTRAIEKSRDG
jgi:hypothetical protein